MTYTLNRMRTTKAPVRSRIGRVNRILGHLSQHMETNRPSGRTVDARCIPGAFPLPKDLAQYQSKVKAPKRTSAGSTGALNLVEPNAINVTRQKFRIQKISTQGLRGPRKERTTPIANRGSSRPYEKALTIASR